MPTPSGKRPTGRRRPVTDAVAGVPADEIEGADDRDAPSTAGAGAAATPGGAGPVEAEGGPVDRGAVDDGPVEGEPTAEEWRTADARAAKPVSARRETWRKRSATGAILSGFAFGLQQVFEPEKREPAIVMETSGDPPRDLPVEAELELATTRRSVVRIRPWLLEDADGPDGDADAGDGDR